MIVKVWNDFINRTEEDQERLLHTSSMKRNEGTKVEDGQGAAAAEAQANSDDWEDLGDNRSGTTGYSL